MICLSSRTNGKHRCNCTIYIDISMAYLVLLQYCVDNRNLKLFSVICASLPYFIDFYHTSVSPLVYGYCCQVLYYKRCTTGFTYRSTHALASSSSSPVHMELYICTSCICIDNSPKIENDFRVKGFLR